MKLFQNWCSGSGACDAVAGVVAWRKIEMKTMEDSMPVLAACLQRGSGSLPLSPACRQFRVSVGGQEFLVSFPNQEANDVSGNVVADYKYAAFGEVLSASGPAANICSFGFQTMYRDPATGNDHFPERIYSTVLHSWLTRDRIQESGGLNLTEAFSNDPINNRDPLGLEDRGAWKYGDKPIAGTGYGYVLRPDGHVEMVDPSQLKGTVIDEFPYGPSTTKTMRDAKIQAYADKTREYENKIVFGEQNINTRFYNYWRGREFQQMKNAAAEAKLDEEMLPVNIGLVFLPTPNKFAMLRTAGGVERSVVVGTRVVPGGIKPVSLTTEARAVAAESESVVFQTGVNITPRSVANQYRAIMSPSTGRAFVTEIQAVENIIGPLHGNRIVISSAQARQLEGALGLTPNSLEARNVISVVSDIPSRAPAAPISGNAFFLGGGKGLPGGGRELTISPIPSAGGQGITQIILEVR